MLPPLRFRKNLNIVKNRFHRLSAKIWLRFENGRFNIIGLGHWSSHWRDPYYLLLTIPWSGFVLLMAGFYGIVNGLFALAYLAGGDCIANATPGDFSDAFFFSVQTLGSIGYGAMYPTTTYAHILVTIEAFISIFGIAMMTGLAFARFSQPTAKVIFSRVAVIIPHNGVPTLMLRVANQRRNQLLEAQMRLYLLWNEVSPEGVSWRRFHQLQLLRSRTPIFSLPWTVMHSIDQESPLYQASPELLEKTKAMIIASLTGIDETVAQPLHARYTYGIDDILWEHRFVDIFYDTPSGHRYVDLTHFHDVAVK